MGRYDALWGRRIAKPSEWGRVDGDILLDYQKNTKNTRFIPLCVHTSIDSLYKLPLRGLDEKKEKRKHQDTHIGENKLNFRRLKSN